MGKAGKVLRLKKALYGLQQAPRDAYLNSLSFTRSDHEHAMYTWQASKRPLVSQDGSSEAASSIFNVTMISKYG
ncbi:hypothetical protein E2562_035203 [Oryza meyeriana var. granulata]|uniref:Reverse transcriptase Ty1/copia-type domain-containing protein n=1 Tax=Oryza meyeriana var. granulata TaxID=110450 RepID=A0A6G1DAC4_9ORYZ|nr:hypothetical protein E2562_035203 [Oryza meyeriana var. granulata]